MNTAQDGKQGGFTLIELLVVVAIIGIISSIAYASYQKSELKSRRADAKSALANLSQTLERCYSQNFKYKGCTTLDSGTISVPSTSQRGYYTVSIPSISTSYYTAEAVAVSTGPQAKDTGCTTLYQTNVGTGSGTPPTTANAAVSDSSSCW